MFSGRLAVAGTPPVTRTAGMYQLNLTAYDGRMTHVSAPRMISVMAAAPHHFYVTPVTQVRFCRDRFSPTGELGYSGIRGAVGSGYRFTV